MQHASNRREMQTGFLFCEIHKERDEQEDLDVGERVVKTLREMVWGCMDWIHLAQVMNQWLVLVDTVIKCRAL
jgi:hypothetical protein